ncbi:hypothetical protein TNCV_2506281 [Trichonephila clavipes]|uniref:Uncharacterized protein n=1 Tax=Trichonephila clavipes TaxID=2585209 RepID=A0A8X6WGD7_TRICX|nr:hypothetical protein TNCV_2506281 [Trichonephila clavipes]
MTRTTPDLAPPSPNYHTTPIGRRLSSREIQRAKPPYTTGLQRHLAPIHDTPATTELGVSDYWNYRSSACFYKRSPRPVIRDLSLKAKEQRNEVENLGHIPELEKRLQRHPRSTSEDVSLFFSEGLFISHWEGANRKLIGEMTNYFLS